MDPPKTAPVSSNNRKGENSLFLAPIPRYIQVMRVLAAFDKFKGSMSAQLACNQAQLFFQGQGIECDTLPISDGGEGFLDFVQASAPGLKGLCLKSHDARFNPIQGEALLPDGEGGEFLSSFCFLESAHWMGLTQLEGHERDPYLSSSAGLGVVLRDLHKEQGYSRFCLGLGGSATIDLGLGALQILGLKIFDASGKEIRPVLPKDFLRIHRIDASDLLLLDSVVFVADVLSPLFGQRGAVQMYGAQKGLAPKDFASFEKRLNWIVQKLEWPRALPLSTPGLGAAGGLAFSLSSCFRESRIVKGFSYLAQHFKLDKKIRDYDLVISGEGRLDRSSLEGKAPWALFQLAKKEGIPCQLFCGEIEQELLKEMGDEASSLHEIAPKQGPLSDKIKKAPQNLQEALKNFCSMLT